MSIRRQIGFRLLIVAAAAVPLVGSPADARGQLVQSASDAAEFPHATLACKVRMDAITETEPGSPAGTKCEATCTVIAWLKGDAGKQLQIAFRRHGNGPFRPNIDAVKSGEVYLVMLRGERPPYEVFAALPATDAVVEPSFGAKPGERLLAEMAAMCKSKDAAMRLAAITQIGLLRDSRGAELVADAAKDADVALARAGLIAQYRLKVAPDARRAMELFDEQMLHVWYEESGVPRKDERGETLWRDDNGRRLVDRGVPGFDYAAYVREGIKHDWVRRDENTLYTFFGVPWKVQRKSCVPELIKLLDHRDKRVRWWAVICLVHTVEGQHEHADWNEYQRREAEEQTKWRAWWRESGAAYMRGDGGA